MTELREEDKNYGIVEKTAGDIWGYGMRVQGKCVLETIGRRTRVALGVDGVTV